MKEKLMTAIDGIAGLYAFIALWTPVIWLFALGKQTGSALVIVISISCAILALYVLNNSERLFSKTSIQ